jgi:hypothetical protein
MGDPGDMHFVAVKFIHVFNYVIKHSAVKTYGGVGV